MYSVLSHYCHPDPNSATGFCFADGVQMNDAQADMLVTVLDALERVNYDSKPFLEFIDQLASHTVKTLPALPRPERLEDEWVLMEPDKGESDEIVEPKTGDSYGSIL